MFMDFELFCICIFLRYSETFDFSREYIFFYVLAVFAEHELPTKHYIDSPSLPPPQYIKVRL